ncbi:hypothetical protein ACC687_39895, partial [Rhizobium ruizarguesonis]
SATESSFMIGCPVSITGFRPWSRSRDASAETARVVALVGHSIPVFWFGIVGLVILYAGLNWVGGPGRIDVFYEGLVTPKTGLLLI